MTWDIAVAIVFAGMAAFGAADLLVNQYGPGGILARLRVRFGAQARADGSARPPTRFFTGVLSCVYCASFWLALAFTGLVGASVLAWGQAWPVVFPLSPLVGYGIAAVMAGRVLTQTIPGRVSALEVFDDQRARHIGQLSNRLARIEDLPHPDGFVAILDMEDQYRDRGLGIYQLPPDAEGEARRRGAWLTKAMAAWPDPTPAPDDDPTPDPAPGMVSTAPAYDPRPDPRVMVVQDANFEAGVYRVEDGPDEDGAMNIARFHGHAAYDHAMEWGLFVDWLLAEGKAPAPSANSITGDPINEVILIGAGTQGIGVEERPPAHSNVVAEAYFFGPERTNRARVYRSRRINRNTREGCVNCHGAGWIFAPWLGPKGILCNDCAPE